VIRVVSQDRRKSLLRARIVVEFEAGFRHVLRYEREDKFILGLEIRVTLDHEEIFTGGPQTGIGSTEKHFSVEGIPAVLKLTGAGIAIWGRLTVGGTTILRL
jgi:hypothetical protein